MTGTNSNSPSGQLKPTSSDLPPDRLWAMVCHLGSLAGFLIPLANILVPLIIWLLKRNEFSFVDDQGKESVNFQISMLIYYVIGLLLCFILIGFIIVPLLVLFSIISVIMATVESSQGKLFRYLFCIRLVK